MPFLPPSAPASAVAEHPPAAEPPALSSSTLAELYLRQGFVDKAIEVYQQLVQREPGNEQARLRLAELSAQLPSSASSSSVASAPPVDAVQDERAARRRGIERTIMRLEELLATVRRHAPAGGTK